MYLLRGRDGILRPGQSYLVAGDELSSVQGVGGNMKVAVKVFGMARDAKQRRRQRGSPVSVVTSTHASDGGNDAVGAYECKQSRTRGVKSDLYHRYPTSRLPPSEGKLCGVRECATMSEGNRSERVNPVTDNLTLCRHAHNSCASCAPSRVRVWLPVPGYTMRVSTPRIRTPAQIPSINTRPCVHVAKTTIITGISLLISRTSTIVPLRDMTRVRS